MPTLGSSFRPAGGSRSIWRTGMALALVAAWLPTALMQRQQAVAQEEEGGFGIGRPAVATAVPPHLKALLSGSSWLAVEGMDPRVSGGAAVNGIDWDATLAAAGGSTSGRTIAGAPQVPFRNPGPAFSRNQIVTRQVGLFPIQTEPHIAVDPVDPDHLVMGTIDYNFPTISTYVSFDGGETWDGPNLIRYFQEDLGAAGDPVIAFDRDGNVFATQISIGIEEFQIGSLLSADLVSSLIVAKSTDGGLTWSDAIPAIRSTITTTSQTDDQGRERGEIKTSFLDKQWFAIGPSKDDPEVDAIHLTYTDFTYGYGILYADEVPFLTLGTLETTIRSVSSTDGGMTWTDPVDVSPTALYREGSGSEQEDGEEFDIAAAVDGVIATSQGILQGEADASEAERFVQGSQPTVLPDGTVAVSYYDSTNDGADEGVSTVMVATSTDGGETFGAPVQAGVFQEVKGRPRTSFFRNGGLPSIASGPNNDVYVISTGMPADKPSDDADVYLMRSLDAGETWEEPLRLNGDDTERLQFFPAIAVSPDGTVHAMWGDMRDDPEEVRYHIYYSESSDQGETWGFELPEQGLREADTRVTDFASNSLRGFPGGRFLGDYFAIAATDEDVFLVWADTRLGEFGGPNQQIGFARKTAIAQPSLFLNPPAGTAGREVTIQGFDFSPRTNVTITVAGVGASLERTDDQGQFTTSIYMPVTGEGPQNISAFDDTGNVATASFFTEFGFDSIQRQIGALQGQLGVAPAPAPAASPVAASPVASPQPLPDPPATPTP